jgi:transcriptional regulator with PAS, ATPase and Fis domain
MRELFARLARVAAMESTVLIQGETGTGKELVARAVHHNSRRREKPLVVVDCGALAENLLEAELFGHARGAFTGASHERAGAIESAAGGTVFLDEIGEMPLSMQPKLLRALESRQVRRVGESRYRDVDVRFIAATHRDLAKMVNDGTFREDLFFRLSVLPVTVPPLRERLDDIPLLVQRMMPEGAAHAVSPELLRELSNRAWSGNVRELRNFVERALALGAREALAMGGVAPLAASAGESLPAVSIDEPFKSLRERWVDHLEREYVRAMLARHDGNVSAVATASGLDRTYVHRLIRKHEL